MAIDPKDIKLLWGKAAGRCSMPNCRRPLVTESDNKSDQHNLHVGEMAHIVGEQCAKKSPRGMSPLPLDKRNLYSNLILLCPTHHTLIDKDVSGWPVERLHATKRDHELWVESQLGKEIDQKIAIYHDFIDRVSLALHLKDWEWLCDNLFRQIMPVEFPDGIYQLKLEHFRAIMPGIDLEFEAALDNLISRADRYLSHYLSESESIPGDPRIIAKKRYKDISDTDYSLKEKFVMIHRVWARNCTMLLFNMVRALNGFASVVRKELRSDFFIRKGNFCVHDFMGLMGGSDVGTWHLPGKYFTQEDLESPVS